jgi:hypothetical protein
VAIPQCNSAVGSVVAVMATVVASAGGLGAGAFDTATPAALTTGCRAGFLAAAALAVLGLVGVLTLGREQEQLSRPVD